MGIALVGIHELTIAKQDYTKVPGEIPTFLGFKPDDPVVFKEKQLKELKNGRLAMLAVLGELMAQKVSGMGTYEQLGTIIDSLPVRSRRAVFTRVRSEQWSRGVDPS